MRQKHPCTKCYTSQNLICYSYSRFGSGVPQGWPITLFVGACAPPDPLVGTPLFLPMEFVEKQEYSPLSV